MTMEALESDFEDIAAQVNDMNEGLTTSGDIVRWFKGNLIPFLRNHVAETADIDKCIGDLVEESDDILTAETGALFAGVIAGGRALAAKLRELVKPGTDAALDAALDEYEKLCNAGEQALEEITLDPPPDDEDADLDDDEDDEDDDGDDEDDEDDDEDDDDEGDK